MKSLPSVELSIVIHNQWDATERLLKSIEKYTHYSNYKIIIIDNASTDITVNKIVDYEDKYEIIYNDQILSFGACHNKVMSRTLCDYVCLLTNEVEITTDYWLTKLIEKAELEKPVGIVSPVKDHLEKLIIGGKLAENAICENIYLNQEDKIIWFHSCCFLINTIVIKHIEVFDERFQVRYYEEVDFCLRSSEAGFKLVYDPDVRVKYYNNEQVRFKQLQGTNRVLFIEKNQEWLDKNKIKYSRKIRYRSKK